MAIVWCGGEPIDFIDEALYLAPYGPYGTFHRTAYSRICCDLGNAAVAGAYCKTPVFASQSLLWFSVIWCRYGGTANFSFFSFASGEVSKLGIAFSSGGYLILRNNETSSNLATSTVTPITGNNGVYMKLDVCIDVANTNVKVYYNSLLQIDYTGALNFAGIDQLIIRQPGSGADQHLRFSEVIVADEDTRTMSLVTLAPNLAGDLNQWTGAYTAIDEYVVDDADVIYSITAEQDFQCNLTNVPAGSFQVKAVKIAARAVRGQTGIRSLKLGIKSGVSVNVDSGTTLDVFWATKERLMLVNPVTSNVFTQAEIDALQINLRSTALVSASISESSSPSVSASVSESISASISESVSESSSPSA